MYFLQQNNFGRQWLLFLLEEKVVFFSELEVFSHGHKQRHIPTAVLLCISTASFKRDDNHFKSVDDSILDFTLCLILDLKLLW